LLLLLTLFFDVPILITEMRSPLAVEGVNYVIEGSPARVTETATAAANCAGFVAPIPNINPVTKAPLKAPPAEVVSTALTFNEGTLSLMPSAVSTHAPPSSYPADRSPRDCRLRQKGERV
jgi:hypothetical protein